MGPNNWGSFTLLLWSVPGGLIMLRLTMQSHIVPAAGIMGPSKPSMAVLSVWFPPAGIMGMPVCPVILKLLVNQTLWTFAPINLPCTTRGQRLHVLYFICFYCSSVQTSSCILPGQIGCHCTSSYVSHISIPSVSCQPLWGECFLLSDCCGIICYKN